MSTSPWHRGAALLLAATVLTGCGSSSQSGSTANIATQVKSLSAKYNPVGQQIGSTLVSAPQLSNQALGSDLNQLSGQVKAAQQEFGALHAPSNIAPALNSYVQSLGTAQHDLSALATAATGSDASSAKQLTKTLIADLKASKRAKQTLNAKLGLPAGE